MWEALGKFFVILILLALGPIGWIILVIYLYNQK